MAYDEAALPQRMAGVVRDARNDEQNLPPSSGPFGMGRQGYLVVAIIIFGSAVFAATRSDWVSMLVIAVCLPLAAFSLLLLLSRMLSGRSHARTVQGRRNESREAMNLLTFLARTNPFMFLLFGAMSRRQDDPEYQELLESGPFTVGQRGHIFLILILVVGLAPLLLTLIFVAVTGHQPTNTGPHP
jgi:hypothetical protein